MRNPETIWNFLRKLSIPRLFGTEGHINSQRLIQETFSQIPNAQFETQTFPAKLRAKSPFEWISVIFIIIPLGLIFSYYISWYAVAFALSIGVFLFALIFLPILGNRYRKRLHNEPAEMGTNYSLRFLPSQKKEHTVVILAHYDSISTRFHIVLSALTFFGAYLFGYLFILQNLIYNGRNVFFQATPLPWTHLAWGIGVSGLFFLRLLNRTQNQSPGTTDNASGVAQIYDLALFLSNNPLSKTEVILVATDAEELGNRGGHAFVEGHISDLPKASTDYIVVDTIGTPMNRVAVGSKFPHKHFSPRLEKIAEEVLGKDKYQIGRASCRERV